MGYEILICSGVVWYKLCIINNVSIPNESPSLWVVVVVGDAGGNPRYASHCLDCLGGEMLTCGHQQSLSSETRLAQVRCDTVARPGMTMDQSHPISAMGS